MDANLEKNKEIWKELLETIPKMQKSVKKGFDRHIDPIHHGHHLKAELDMFQADIELIRGTYTLDIIFALSGLKHAYFNELKEILSYANIGTVSKRLKELEKANIIHREVQTGTPIRVSYKLTPKGEGVFSLLLPLLIYMKFFPI